MDAKLPDIAVAEHLAERIAALDAASCPPRCARNARRLLIDVIGLCITARNEDYVGSALAGWDDDGPCTAIGHARALERGGRGLRSTAPRRMARISTTPSRAARCMPAR